MKENNKTIPGQSPGVRLMSSMATNPLSVSASIRNYLGEKNKMHEYIYNLSLVIVFV